MQLNRQGPCRLLSSKSCQVGLGLGVKGTEMREDRPCLPSRTLQSSCGDRRVRVNKCFNRAISKELHKQRERFVEVPMLELSLQNKDFNSWSWGRACQAREQQEEENGGNGQSGGAGLKASTFENLNKCTHTHTQLTVPSFRM